jgi:transcriptional regulator with XRE-family HTH domain
MEGESIGQRIKSVRERRGITQKWLAEQIRISKQAMWAIENGGGDIGGKRVAEFAKILRVSSDYLLGLKEDEELGNNAEVLTMV